MRSSRSARPNGRADSRTRALAFGFGDDRGGASAAPARFLGSPQPQACFSATLMVTTTTMRTIVARIETTWLFMLPLQELASGRAGQTRPLLAAF